MSPVAGRSTRQRRVGQPLPSVALTALPVLIVVVLAVLAGQLPSAVLVVGAVVAVALLLLTWRGGYAQLLWFGRAELDLDEQGVFFGVRGRTRSTSVSHAAQLPHRAPWAAITDVRLVVGAPATRTMARRAVHRRSLPQPSSYYGYYPVRWRRAHLAMTVDLTQAERPDTHAGTNTASRSGPMLPSRTWVLPVRDVDSVRSVLTAHGIPPLETTEPVLPLPDVDEVGELGRRVLPPGS